MSIEGGLEAGVDGVQHGVEAVAHSPVTAKIALIAVEVGLPIIALFAGYQYLKGRFSS